jgi:hypothetical protein
VATDSTIERASAHFRDMGLAFPHIPEESGDGLAQLSEWVFATRTDAPGPYDIDWFVTEACTRSELGYLLIGQDGHGINSYAMHYYLVLRPLALFVQSGWGGVYMDPAESARDIESRFRLARRLVDAAHVAATAGRFGPHERLIVVESDFFGGRWARLQVPVGDVRAIAWNESDKAMKAALAAPVLAPADRA